MEEYNKRSLILGVVIGIALGYGAALFLRPKESVDIIKSAPVLTSEQIVGTKTLTGEEKKAVAFHKNTIVQRVASPVPLTAMERNIIADILIRGSRVYDFTEAERTLIGRTLNSKP